MTRARFDWRVDLTTTLHTQGTGTGTFVVVVDGTNERMEGWKIVLFCFTRLWV